MRVGEELKEDEKEAANIQMTNTVYGKKPLNIISEMESV